MNLHDTFAFLHEAALTEPLVIYVSIGCSLARYPPNEHPPQQYPPYLRAFARRQICVLIDPHLEMPPRAHEDIKGIPRDITILPVLEWFEHSTNDEKSTAWFLHDLARLCSESKQFLIVQDFTGMPLNEHYPFHLGMETMNYVLYDPTYSMVGNCFPDLNRANIYRNERGLFRQPLYSPLSELREHPALLRHLIEQRNYNSIHLVARLYKIMKGEEPPNDWCTVAQIARHLHYFARVYRIPEGDNQTQVRLTLRALVQDHGLVAGRHMVEPEIDALLEGPRKELEVFLKTVV